MECLVAAGCLGGQVVMSHRTGRFYISPLTSCSIAGKEAQKASDGALRGYVEPASPAAPPPCQASQKTPAPSSNTTRLRGIAMAMSLSAGLGSVTITDAGPE